MKRFLVYATALSWTTALTLAACGEERAPVRPSDSEDGGGDAGSTGTAGASSTGGNGSGGAGTGGQIEVGERIAGTEHYDCTDAEGSLPALELVTITDGFDAPILVTHAPGDTERLFVVELGGLIRIVRDGAIEDAPFLDLSTKVIRSHSEQGLLGLAFHPSFDETGLFYVHYSAPNGNPGSGDTLIEEYRVSDDPDVADVDSARTVLRQSQPDQNHNGGTISFGIDGLLYVFLGDGGGSGDQYHNSQTLTSLLGKVLRIDPRRDGDADYTIPPGNLREELDEALPEIWDYGMRNPYRANFDACTGHLYIGDVGQGELEEIDIERVLDGRRNYGWPIMEGLSCYAASTCDQEGLTLPVADFENIGGSAILGGAVYRGASIPALRGAYFYADYGHGRIWNLRFDGTTASTPISLTDELNPPAGLTSIQNGGDGELYLTQYGDPGMPGSGVLLRISAQ